MVARIAFLTSSFKAMNLHRVHNRDPERENDDMESTSRHHALQTAKLSIRTLVQIWRLINFADCPVCYYEPPCLSSFTFFRSKCVP